MWAEFFVVFIYVHKYMKNESTFNKYRKTQNVIDSMSTLTWTSTCNQLKFEINMGVSNYRAIKSEETRKRIL